MAGFSPLTKSAEAYHGAKVVPGAFVLAGATTPLPAANISLTVESVTRQTSGPAIFFRVRLKYDLDVTSINTVISVTLETPSGGEFNAVVQRGAGVDDRREFDVVIYDAGGVPVDTADIKAMFTILYRG